ncbi:MAG: ATP-binding protein [Oryzihumus sp.]
MDWFLKPDDASAVGELRREVVAYLRRHAEPDSEVEDAELALSEVVGNAVRHAGGPVWVSLYWAQAQPVLTVRDLGPGFDPARLAQPVTLAPRAGSATLAEAGLGLFLVSQVTPSLAAEVRRAGGMTVSVTLPVNRAPALSHDPPRRTFGALPELDEALPGGGFGKESFLRALVVQLARTVETQQGPDAAAAAVAQVGADIGGQMEEEFRAAGAIVGRLTPEQMADCYVRLKHAIDGGFYVIEATEHRIVLGNTRCPFGNVVRRAPSLCRMTSSVFGGIAARNSDHGVAVLLEERIAVGDPGCRVVVDLAPPPEGGRPLAHEYAAAADATLFPG